MNSWLTTVPYLNMKRKFKIVTLGCRTNQYESQGYSDQLSQMGFLKAQGKEKADLCIVNTCTVTHFADRSSKTKIRKLIQENPHSKVVVTGCLVENAKKELLELGENVEVVSNKEKEKLVQKIFPEEKDLPEFNIRTFEAHTRAFVKIQDGCNSFCTYCIIPYVRGRSRSRKMKDILKEIKTLVQNGYKEVVLTGINIGDFDGGDGSSRLSDLIHETDQIEGVQRIRVSSIDPDEVDDDLTKAIIQGKKTCASMHIVLQSGSNVVLKRMNRKYTRQMFFETVEKLKSQLCDFTVTTDIIVGFPGESEEDFEETLDVMKKVNFAKVHMFPYSPRPRTRAFSYPDQVDPLTLSKRKNELLRLSEKNAFDLREQFIGREMKVLIEDKEKNGFVTGHTENFLRVKVLSEEIRPNEIVAVKLIKNQPDGLIGKLCS